MAKIQRKNQLIFGGGLSAPDNIAEFGSLAAGAPAYSLDPDSIQTARYLNAWAAALVNAPGGLASPALQDMNALFFLLSRQLAYLFQAGVPEWNSSTVYYLGSWAVDGGGTPYKSLNNDNVGNALTDTNWWVPLRDTLVQSASTCKAWVCFDGTTGGIRDSFNVSSVSRTAVGSYVLNFGTPMANASYSWAGSVGALSGVGNNDLQTIVGVYRGRVSVKSTTQLTVFCSNTSSLIQDNSSISVQIFGH